MITAVDTSVLLDVLAADATHGRRSREAMRQAMSEGGITGCAVVWAEVGAGFPSAGAAREALEKIGVAFGAIDESVALAAGAAWRSYRRAGGTRTRLLADFLIGAHAAATADRLLTRDRGFYRHHFSDLPLLDPTTR